MKSFFPRPFELFAAVKSPIFALVIMNLVASCAVMRAPTYRNNYEEKPPSDRRLKIVYDAQQYLGRNRIRVKDRVFHYDCSGLLLAVYYKNGINLTNIRTKRGENLVKGIYNFVKENGVLYVKENPKPGDIVFFSNTYKRFGKNPLSHAGIIESVHDDGTITFIHKSSSGIVRDKMNLGKPFKRRDPQSGEIINGYLRRKSRRDPPGTRYLAGALFETFGDVLAR